MFVSFGVFRGAEAVACNHLSNKKEVMVTENKIYVLDTNVLIHDPTALQRFDEHEVVLPIVVLEEMDKVKRGFDELARNVREVSRELDKLTQNCEDLQQGVSLPGGGRLRFELNHQDSSNLPLSLDAATGDNRILSVTLWLRQQYPKHQVILVSKDINIRIKARALGLQSEDYRSDQVCDDPSVLPTGMTALSAEQWASVYSNIVSQAHDEQQIQVRWPEELPLPRINQFLLQAQGENISMCTSVNEERQITLQHVPLYRGERQAIWGVQARNHEQAMAMHLLMQEKLDLITLLGLAGSGKTLLALACGLHQTLELGRFERILITRATVPMGQDIGFLPGSEREKMEPWMGAVSDNLDYLLRDEENGDRNSLLVQHKIEITAMAFARGRTFTNTWVIVDEAQNLTPHQMKTLITRIGKGSRLIILGNNAQIDTPYLTAHSNGLTLAVMRFQGWQHAAHITLKASERSRLAARANEVL